jgi:predicted nucleotidyltransferase
MIGLQGENRIEKFRQVADGFVSQVVSSRDVANVVYVDGLARGFADRFSDVDITVFLDKKNERLGKQIRRMSQDIGRRFGIDMDLEVHCLEAFRNSKWDEACKWDYSNVKIVFDAKKEITNMLSEKLGVPKDFWTRRIVVCSTYLRWYCCPPNEDIGTISQAWIERGDFTSAHYCLNYSTDLLLKILLALNRKFLPAAKWRIFYSYTLEWLPSNYNQLIKEAMVVRSLSARDIDRRLKALSEIWHETADRIERETRLTADLILEYYVKKILHQA